MHLSAPMYQNVFRAYINPYGNSNGKETEVTVANQAASNPSVMLKIEKIDKRHQELHVDVSLPKGEYYVFLPYKKSYHLGEKKRICFGNIFGIPLISHDGVQNVPEGFASLPKHPLQIVLCGRQKGSPSKYYDLKD